MELFAPELNKTEYKASHSTYEFVERKKDDGLSTLTLTDAGGIKATFTLPKKVYNLKRTRFICTANYLGAGILNNFTYVFTNGILLIKNIVIRGRDSNINCIDYKDINILNEMIIRRYKKIQDLLSRNKSKLSGLTICNLTTGVLKPNENAAVVPGTLVLEPLYLKVGAAGANGNTATGAVTLNYDFEFGDFVRTFFETDTNIYFGQEVDLEIEFERSSSLQFNATSATDPTTGIAKTSDITLTNIKLMLCTEKNPLIEEKMIADVNNGIVYNIPHFEIKRISQTSTNGTITWVIPKSAGSRLKGIAWANYNAAESANQTWEHNNTVAATRINTFKTKLNSVDRTSYFIDCTQYMDYYMNINRLKGSCIFGESDYYYNWCFEDLFTADTALMDRPFSPQEAFIDDGHDIPKDGATYDIEYNGNAAATRVFYLIAYLTNYLYIGPLGMEKRPSKSIPLPNPQ